MTLKEAGEVLIQFVVDTAGYEHDEDCPPGDCECSARKRNDGLNEACRALTAATTKVDVSGASTTMQAGGMPRRGQDRTDAAEPFGYFPHPEDFDYIVKEIEQRRAQQDQKHGGENHDDTHVYFDWMGFIKKFSSRAYAQGMHSRWDAYENYLIDVAALAIAAIQSSRRIRHRGRQ